MTTKTIMSVPFSVLISVMMVATLITPIAFAEVTAAPAAQNTSVATSTTATNTVPTLMVGSTTVADAKPVIQPYQIESISGNTLQMGDYVVGPGRLEVTVKPGETVVRNMTVTNRISNGRQFELTVEDLSGSADASQAVVLLGDKNGPYTLKDDISYPAKKFSLDLGQRAIIPVSITMPPNAEPGGYYGAVLVSTVQEGMGDANAEGAHSPIISRIGTLFFITVPGKADIEGKVKDFSTKNNQWWFEKGPITMSLLYENTGAVHLNPYGEIHITNMFGGEVGFVEVDPWFILPKSLRLRELTWDREFLFGRYTITAKINRGYDNVIEEKVIHIWVLPWKILAGIFVGLFLLISFIRFFFRSFEFKRKS
jgi:hypothetical protein